MRLDESQELVIVTTARASCALDGRAEWRLPSLELRAERVELGPQCRDLRPQLVHRLLQRRDPAVVPVRATRDSSAAPNASS